VVTSVKHFQPHTQECTCSPNFVNPICANVCCSQSPQSNIEQINVDSCDDLIAEENNTLKLEVKRLEQKVNMLEKQAKVRPKLAPKTYEGVLRGYDSNSRTYHVFNVTTGCVEITCDTVFDETNGSQKEQVDLDLIDDEEASCDALQRMVIDDVRPQDPSNQSQETSPNDTTPPAQGLDQDNYKEDVEPNDQGQE
jgi:hypothetical protein